MPEPSPFRLGRLAGLIPTLALAGLAGCAQPEQSAVRYDTSRENTRLDAESYAMGSAPRGASQIQLGFGSAGPAEARAAVAEPAAEGTESAPPPRPLAEARSFLGTVPCPSGMACEAARFMVTLAPSGEWRARTSLLVQNKPTQTLVEQGCWSVIGDPPLRIALLQTGQSTAKADLSFLNSNTLRIHAMNGVQPLLEHRLTRQADIDPIDELRERAALKCL